AGHWRGGCAGSSSAHTVPSQAACGGTDAPAGGAENEERERQGIGRKVRKRRCRYRVSGGATNKKTSDVHLVWIIGCMSIWVWIVRPGDTLCSLVPRATLCDPNSEFFKRNPE
ncbi:unnamed protein product, partial [Closterium sp. NIES-54]